MYTTPYPIPCRGDVCISIAAYGGSRDSGEVAGEYGIGCGGDLSLRGGECGGWMFSNWMAKNKNNYARRIEELR